MKRIIFMIGILSFFSSFSFAADQKLDKKQIFELRKECGKISAEFAQRWKLCKGTGNYQSHYNIKLNICFIHMTASCNEKGNKFWAESVIDVNENKDYATYTGDGKLFDDKPALCSVESAGLCKSLLEFHELIKPYMNE